MPCATCSTKSASDRSPVPPFEVRHYLIDNVIEKVVTLLGIYYSALPDEAGGAPIDNHDLPFNSPYGTFIRSQAFIALVAALDLNYIKTDNIDTERVGVGMAEVSTREVTVMEGKNVKTGDELDKSLRRPNPSNSIRESTHQ